MYSKSIVLAFGLLEMVAGHCTVVAVNGDANSVTGMGLGVTPGVKRNSQIPTAPSSSPNNPEADTSVFGHGAAAATGCGKTAMNGALKDAGAISAAVQTMSQMAGGIPAVTPGGTLMVQMHQVNADGAPTYKADIDPSGTGTGTFTPINVASGGTGAAGFLGDQGLSFNIGQLPANNTVAITMPSNMACTGTNGMCMVRLMNNAAAGGFGSCIPVTMAASGTATGATSASSAAPATKERRHSKDVLKVREVPITWLE